MPCKEMKELEASFRHQTDTNLLDGSTHPNKVPDGIRHGEARVAYVMLTHRRKCEVCRTPPRFS